MTWAPVGGVRVWNHKTFVEPSDEELEEYGWSKPTAAQSKQPRGSHVCLDCKEEIHRQSTRCWRCEDARRKAAAAANQILTAQEHTCPECSAPMARRSRRCQKCHLAAISARGVAARAEGQHSLVDEAVVERILAGDWKLPTTKGEKITVVERWLEQGGTSNALHKLTGWRIERYVVQRDRQQDVAA